MGLNMVLQAAALLAVTVLSPQDKEKKVAWVESLSEAQSSALSKKRGIILYVQPRGEINPPAAFQDRRVIDASEEIAVFLRIRFDEEDPVLADLRIKGAPVVVAFDYHLNVYGSWAGAPSGSQIAEAASKIPDWAAANRQQLRQSLNSAINLRDGNDTSGAVRAIQNVLNSGLKGFDEIRQAQQMLQSLADSVFKKIDAMAAEGKTKEATAQYRQAGRTFAGTALAAEADVRLARLHLVAGETQEAIQQALRARRAHAKSAPEAAAKVEEFLAKLTAQGIAEIRRILEEGLKGEPANSRDRLRALAKAYEGTDVSTHAADVLRDLEP